MRNVEIKIKGRVQGVGFRYHTCQVARELGIKGYVKNLSDGSVFIEASSASENMDKFINWCHLGPRLAVVESVQVFDTNSKEFKEFNVQ